MPSYQKIKLKNSGFSLVEIMVGMVIALLSTIIILQVFSTFEGQKRTSTSGSDAQSSGAFAIYTVERDVRMAGYGFSDPTVLGCPIKRNFNGANIADLLLAPIVITNGANGLSDSITVLSSSKGSWSLPTRITTDHPPTATNFFLNTTLGIAEGDLLIAYEPGKDCTMLQVTGIPNGNVQIHHQNTSPWNPPGGQNIFPLGGYGTGTMLFNLGAIINHTYSLDNQNNLIFSDYNSVTNVTANQILMPDIVNLQAQYGFDTRVGVQPDARVDTWSDVMLDADANGIIGNAGDIARVYAVRMAIVARSAQPEKVDADDGLCKITLNPPTWAYDAATNTSTNINVSITPVSGTAIADWQCYRYKTFETVIPLRNLIWRQ